MIEALNGVGCIGWLVRGDACRGRDGLEEGAEATGDGVDGREMRLFGLSLREVGSNGLEDWGNMRSMKDFCMVADFRKRAVFWISHGSVIY
jgi:hypothetical protein